MATKRPGDYTPEALAERARPRTPEEEYEAVEDGLYQLPDGTWTPYYAGDKDDESSPWFNNPPPGSWDHQYAECDKGIAENKELERRKRMKPLPAREVPGNTEAERMDNAVRMMLSVPKEEYLKQEARLKRAHGRKRAAKKPT